MKKWLLILAAAIMALSCVLSACGEDKKDEKATEAASAETAATQETSAVKETTVVLETTAEGGTVEKDSDGNKITRDKNGEIVAVEDKNGNPIEITEYITTHQWITESRSSGGSSANKSDGASSESQEDITEGTIPVVIASVPDEDDIVDLDSVE